MSLRFLTAGESHGPSLTTILDGMPAGLPITPEMINKELAAFTYVSSHDLHEPLHKIQIFVSRILSNEN